MCAGGYCVEQQARRGVIRNDDIFVGEKGGLMMKRREKEGNV
jgi:hypothetical protein